MKTLILALAALGALSLGAPAASAAPKHCPPGLAKKSPSCVPPGLAKRGGGDRDDGDRYRERYGDRYDRGYREGYIDGYRVAVGDVLRRGDYRLIRDPGRYNLRPYRGDDWRYYLVRDTIVRADPDTRRVLAIVGLAELLLN